MKALISGNPVLHWVGQVQHGRGSEVAYPWEEGLSKPHSEIWYVYAGEGRIRCEGGPWRPIRGGTMAWIRRDLFHEWRQDPEKPIGLTFFHFDLRDAAGGMLDDAGMPLVLEAIHPLLIESVSRRVVELLWEAYHEEVVKGGAVLDSARIPTPRFESESDRVRHEPFLPGTMGIQFPPEHGGHPLLCQAVNLFRCMIDDYQGLAQRSISLQEVGLQLHHRRAVCGWAARIQENLAAVPSISEMASQCGYGLDHFGRVFRKVMGCGPQEFVVRARVARARQLLLESDLSIKQIASELGYSSAFYFSRQFKAMTGGAPTDFRRQHLGGGAGGARSTA
jgi:AraC-like DNA-binding protein